MKNTYNFMGKGNKYVQAVSRLLGPDFLGNQDELGITFTSISHKNRPLLRLVDSAGGLHVIFFVAVPSLHKDNPVTLVHEADGHSTYHLHTQSVSEVYGAIEVALTNFKPQDIL